MYPKRPKEFLQLMVINDERFNPYILMLTGKFHIYTSYDYLSLLRSQPTKYNSKI